MKINKLILNIAICAILCSCTKQVDYDPDYKISSQIIAHLFAKDESKDTIRIAMIADNKIISDIFERNFEDEFIFEFEKERKSFMSFPEHYKSKLSVLEHIFSRKNYNHIKNQIGNSTWDNDKLNNYFTPAQLYISDNYQDEKVIFITKVFTIDNKYVLVVVYDNEKHDGLTYTSLEIFKNENGKLIWDGVILTGMKSE